ncbi:hypothetical protein L6452_35022 [Arctium lappa]|uniref:Uncharacterized protein n=1 Tax=Arctium lappa TaxID=4217 RepID=A0ACB8YLC2_ARCLA|nr:hypothetical protein L6452_35022 [Arctium lappa]
MMRVYTQELVRSDKFKTGKEKHLDNKIIDTEKGNVITGRIRVTVKSDTCWMSLTEKDDVGGEDGDEANSLRLRILPSVLCANIEFWVILCNESIVLQASDPTKFQNFLQKHDFHYQAPANGVAQHDDQRRAAIEKEKMEKASTTS